MGDSPRWVRRRGRSGWLPRAGVGTAALALLLLVGCPGARGRGLPDLRLPGGFRIDLFAGDVEDARSLAVGERGTVFVGSRSAGLVRALVDDDGDGRADRRYVIARGLDMPNGVAFHRGALYVAEMHRILRFDGIEERLEGPPAPVVIRDDLPRRRHHGWRYLRVGPDDKLYLSIGAPCNVCLEEDPRFASIVRLELDGSDLEIFARGVRNSVGFDWHPETGVFWFTDNGRDLLGDDLPADELNRAPTPGAHYGFPFCHEGGLLDPEWGKGKTCSDYVPPAARLGAHVAALGVHFYRGDRFPAAYRTRAFIAEHGSWNRSEKVGYRVVVATVEAGRVTAVEPFIEGWLAGEDVRGRPVDVVEALDGSLLISDDFGDRIYRVDVGAGTGAGRAGEAD